MSSILSPSEIACILGAAFLNKEEQEVKVEKADVLANLDGFTPDRIRLFVHVVREDDMTDVRVNFSGHPGHGFAFKVFTDEATEARIRRYTQHYLKRHQKVMSMMK